MTRGLVTPVATPAPAALLAAAAAERRAEALGVARAVALALLVGAAYYVGAQLGFALTFRGTPTSIFWLPNATMFAVFLVAAPANWWRYALAALPAHLAVQLQHHMPWTAMLLLFGTNIGDGALGAMMVRAFGSRGRPRFDSFRAVAVFLVSAIAATFAVSFLDAGIMFATGRSDDYWMVWHTRSRSNVLTSFILAPTLVIAVTEGRSWWRTNPPARYLEAAALALSHVLLASLVFGVAPAAPGQGMALLYAPLPLFLWAAARFGTGGVSFSLVGFAFLLIWYTVHGHGPFARSAAIDVLTLQVFLTLLAAPLLLLSAILSERRRVEAALRDREAQYRSIFESTGEGLLITDLSHGVVAANPAFGQLTGYPVEKLGGAPPGTFMHLDDLQPFETFLSRAGTDDVVETQALCVRQDGGLRRVEIRGRRFDYGGVPHVLSVVRDVTEHERALALLEQRVAERTRALSTLLQISNTVASTLELEPLLRLVLEQLQMLVSYTGATIFGMESGSLVILAHRGPLTPDQVRKVNVPLPGNGEMREALSLLRRDGPLVVEDLGGDGASARALRADTPRELQELFGYARSLIIVPLKARDRVIGFLRIDSSEVERYGLQDAELASALANQAAIAIENAYLYEQARGLAAHEERQRLARELHDSVTQTLYASAMLGDLLPRTWERDPDEGRRSLANLREMTRTALAEMRTLLLELRPGAVLQSDLGELLRQLAEALRSRSEAPIAIEVKGTSLLPPDVHVTLYRVAQEALANVTRHAGASRVLLTLECSDDAATLSVRDDGVGFEPGAVGPGHLGLNIMRERLEKIGGTLMIDSAPGAGTLLRASWPAPAV